MNKSRRMFVANACAVTAAGCSIGLAAGSENAPYSKGLLPRLDSDKRQGDSNNVVVIDGIIDLALDVTVVDPENGYVECDSESMGLFRLYGDISYFPLSELKHEAIDRRHSGNCHASRDFIMGVYPSLSSLLSRHPELRIENGYLLKGADKLQRLQREGLMG